MATGSSAARRAAAFVMVLPPPSRRGRPVDRARGASEGRTTGHEMTLRPGRTSAMDCRQTNTGRPSEARHGAPDGPVNVARISIGALVEAEAAPGARASGAGRTSVTEGHKGEGRGGRARERRAMRCGAMRILGGGGGGGFGGLHLLNVGG